jgi:hypothetical protein
LKRRRNERHDKRWMGAQGCRRCGWERSMPDSVLLPMSHGWHDGCC